MHIYIIYMYIYIIYAYIYNVYIYIYINLSIKHLLDLLTCKAVVTVFFPRVYSAEHLVMPSGKHYQKLNNIKLLPLITINLCLHFMQCSQWSLAKRSIWILFTQLNLDVAGPWNYCPNTLLCSISMYHFESYMLTSVACNGDLGNKNAKRTVISNFWIKRFEYSYHDNTSNDFNQTNNQVKI